MALLPVYSQDQDPGAQQDAEAAREKLLKAADQLDNIQANSESTRLSVEGMKADVAKLQGDVSSLQSDNAALKQQVASLQTALDQSEAEHVKERQILLDEVAKMIAAGREAKPGAKKKTSSETTGDAANSAPARAPNADKPAAPSNLTPPPDTPATPSGASSAGGDTTSGDDTPPAPKPQKGYYHIVESGETLTMICKAYREDGIDVTVSQIKKANGLTDSTILKGQKLFIPKPAN